MQGKDEGAIDRDLQEEPTDDSSRADISDSKDRNHLSESDEVISTPELDKNSRELPNELNQPTNLFLQGLRRWGPFRRWSSYCQYRQDENAQRDSQRGKDQINNTNNRLPDNETVQIPGVWVTELYTPSTVQGLLKGISDLGWEFGRSRNDSLTEWMSDVREGRQTGSINLGMVSPPDVTHLMCEHTAPLPSGAIAAFPILESITPSITAFTIVFIFNDDTASSLNKLLRAELTTKFQSRYQPSPWHVIRHILWAVPLYFGECIYPPDLVRRNAVQAKLRKTEKNCINWVKYYLPGAFSSMPDIRLPTAVLIVTKLFKPLSEESLHIRAFEGLSIAQDFDSWESDDWPNGRLVIPGGWNDEQNRLVFAGRRDDAFPDKDGYHEPASNWSIAQRANYLIPGLLSRFAISCLLDSYHEVLSTLRDRSARDGQYRPVRDLKELRTLARTQLYDISACTQEVLEFVDSPLRYGHNTMEMSYVRNSNVGKRYLINHLRSSQTRRAQQVQREASLLQSTLSISSNLSQTISNIRIQRLIVLLTVVSIGIALWAVYLTSSTVS